MSIRLPEPFLHEPPPYMGCLGSGGVMLGAFGSVELNLHGIPFPGWSSAADRRNAADAVLATVSKMRRYHWLYHAEMSSLSRDERLLLLTRGQLSSAMAARQDGVHVLISESQCAVCFINDEEHLMLQRFAPGAQAPEKLCKELLRLRGELCKKLPIAQAPGLGYLSADPSKTGEGVFFSYLMHLPALRLAQLMPKVKRGLNEMGIFTSPLFCAAGKEPGDMHLFHSPVAELGAIENTLALMSDTMQRLARQEQDAREKLQESLATASPLQAGIAAALAKVSSAKPLKYADLLHTLSMLRLGVDCGHLQVDCSPSTLASKLSKAYWECSQPYMEHTQGLTTQSSRRRMRAQYLSGLAREQLRLRPTSKFNAQ